MSSAREDWLVWVRRPGMAEALFDWCQSNLEGVTATCVHCRATITLDAGTGTGGVFDWHTHGGDYGCDSSPESGPDGCGGHTPGGV